MAEMYDDEEQTGYGGYTGMPGLAVFGNPYSTPEARDFAKKYLERFNEEGVDEEVDAYMAKVRAQNEVSKRALRAARDKIANERRSKAELWFALAQGFGSPTRTGSWGEQMANVAGALSPAVSRYDEETRARDKRLLDIDLAIAQVDNPELAAQLQILKMKQEMAGRMGVKALDVLSRPPQGMEKNVNASIQARDRDFGSKANEWLGGGQSQAQKSLNDLRFAESLLRGIDPTTGARINRDDLSGPIVGSLSKIPKIGDWVQSLLLPDAANLRQMVEYTVQQSLKPVLGSQFTENEGERLISRVYNPVLDEETNARRLLEFRTAMERMVKEKAAMVDYYQRNHTLGPSPENPQGYQGTVSFDGATVEDLFPMGTLTGDETLVKKGVGIPAPKKKPSKAPQGDIPEVYPWTPAGSPPSELTPEDIATYEKKFGKKPPGYAEGGRVKPNRTPRRFTTRMDSRGREVLKWKQLESADELREKLDEMQNFRPRPSDVPRTVNFADGGIVGENVLRGARPFTPEEWDAAMLSPLPGEGPEDIDENVAGMLGELMAKYSEPAAGGVEDAKLAELMRKYLGPQFTQQEAERFKAALGESLTNPMGMQEGGEVESEEEMRPVTMPDGSVYNVPISVPDQVAIIRYMNSDAYKGAALEPELTEPVQAAPSEYAPDTSDAVMQAVGQGGAGALGGYTAARVLQRASDLIPGRRITPAEAKILEALENEGSTPGEWMKAVTRAQKLGIPASALDMGGVGMEALAAQSVNPNSKGSRKLLKELEKRQKGAGERVEERVNLALKPDNFKDEMAKYAAAQDQDSMDILNFGRYRFGKVKPDDVEAYVSKLNYAQKDALRTGVAYHLYDTLNNTSKRSNPAQAIFGSPGQERKLQLVFDKPKEFEILKEALDLENKIYDQSASTMRRTKTALMTEGDPSDPLRRHAQLIARRAPGIRWWGRPLAWAMRILRANPEMNPKEAEEIIKILRTNDRKAMEKLEKNLTPKVGRAATRKKVRKGSALIGGVAAAARPLYEEFERQSEELEEEEEPVMKARGGLVRRKPDWMTTAEQVLNSTMYGGDDLVSSIIR